MNYYLTLKLWRPDFIFVESAWQGWRNSWKYKIASYPDIPARSNKALAKVISYARDLNIPCIFWNKEDGVHFDRFIASAALFDIIFTVDESCVSRYKDALGASKKVFTLPFAIQPQIHYHSNTQPKIHRANFVGSYSHHIHAERRTWQNMMFSACEPYGLTVFDRNSDRKSKNYRYPDLPWIDVHASIPYQRTAEIYRSHLVSLNVNTVTDSPTMYSRRLIEIIACGGIAVTNPALSIDRYFADYCEVVHSREECDEVLARIFGGQGKAELERARAGANYVSREHTWEKRMSQIIEAVGL
ncbi:MAG: glycosyltransferase [Pseudomonadota bacterium]|nr:glycosyltransferase [Pseudomonadota bacterium]